MEDMLNVAMPFLIGLFLIGLGGFFLWNERRMKQICTSQVSGVVADEGHYVRYKNGKRKEGYKPTFSYSVEGVEYTKQKDSYSSTRKVSTGQSVTVFYDPAKPNRFYVLELGSVKGSIIVWIPCALGVLFILVGFIIRHFAD